MELRPYQVDCVNQLRDGYRQGFRRQLLTSPTGSGKCFGAGTMVLMFDGITRPIESIKVGQLVMGPDSRPRRVVSLARGREQLYRVVPKKGASYVVNASHVLSLKISGTDVATCGGVRFTSGQVANVTVGDYLSANLTFRHVAKGWRTGVEFMPKRIPPELPPYILGVWLGDGSSRTTEIYGIDHEVIREFQWFALSMGLSVHAVTDGVSCPSYRITSRKKTGRGVSLNVFATALRKFELIRNKHVPVSYKYNSRSVRLEVLAGLMDTDGHLACGGFDFISKFERLADDVCFLSRSVGLAAYVQKCSKTCGQTGATGTYYRVSISGNTSIIPCRVARKRAPVRKQKKDVLVVGVRLEPVGEGDYYGFELDGPDRLFLLWDFTVVHNTVLFSFITKSSAAKGQRTVIMAHRSEILRQISETLDTVGVPHKVLRAGMATPKLAQTVVASVNTLGRRLDGFPPPDLCIVDECFPAGTMISTPTGEVPIESVHPGSQVLAFDPVTNRFSSQTVTATMQRVSVVLVQVRISNGSEFHCTPNHPVLTISRGWITAESLTATDMVRTIMPHEEMRRLWKSVSQQALRPAGVPIGVQPTDYSGLVQEARRSNNPVSDDERNAPSGSPSVGVDETASHGLEAAIPWRERDRSDVRSEAHRVRPRMEYGGCCSDKDAEGLWIPDVLQAGRGEHGHVYWRGSRWRVSQISGSTSKGREEGCISRWSRVESAQVYQPSGGDGSPSVRVYNLEVTGPHTYIASGVVVHNCHHSAAGTWSNVFGSWPTTRFLGVTATPERLDGKGLGDYYDRMVRGPEVEWLISNGFLSPPRYFAPARMIDASAIRKVAGEYAKNDAAKLFDKPTITGDAVIQYRKICPGKTAVAFAISIAHAVHVAAQFRGSGIPASVIDGTMTDEQRSQCIADLRARRILVLVSCELISEGFDLPAVEAVILLRPTASLALHLQQIGRGLRVSPGKLWTSVLDHVGNCLRHGLAEEPRDWSLDGYAARKRKEEEAPLKTRRCEKCFAIFNGPVCPSCGAPYETKGREVENVAGDLKQISPEKLAAIRARNGEERGCKSLEDFQKLGAARGYRPGWAMWRWKNSWRNKPTPA